MAVIDGSVLHNTMRSTNNNARSQITSKSDSYGRNIMFLITTVVHLLLKLFKKTTKWDHPVETWLWMISFISKYIAAASVRNQISVFPSQQAEWIYFESSCPAEWQQEVKLICLADGICNFHLLPVNSVLLPLKIFHRDSVIKLTILDVQAWQIGSSQTGKCEFVWKALCVLKSHADRNPEIMPCPSISNVVASNDSSDDQTDHELKPSNLVLVSVKANWWNFKSA